MYVDMYICMCIYIYIYIYIKIGTHSMLNSHYKAWSYKKRKHKKKQIQGHLFRKNLQLIGVC